MLGKIDEKPRVNAIFFTEVKWIADADADQPISLSFVLFVIPVLFMNLRTRSNAKMLIFVGMNRQRYSNQ